MRYGIAFGMNVDNLKIAANAGYDYVECGFYNLSRGDEELRKSFMAEIKTLPLKLEAANCFIPGELKVTGPDEIKYGELSEYIDKGMYNGAEIGLKKIVFGSSGSRKIPEGFSYAEGFRQMIYFLGEIVAPIAAKYGIKIVTEPLNPKETNMINTAREGIMLAAAVNHKNITGLVDLYQMAEVGDTYDDIRLLTGCIEHSHIALPGPRTFPLSQNDYDFKGFIDALRFAGCETCTVEANTDDFAKEAPLALSFLRSL